MRVRGLPTVTALVHECIAPLTPTLDVKKLTFKTETI